MSCPVLTCLLSDCLSCLSVTLVYCGQTVGWIKMKLGKQVGHIVLDGDPAIQASPSTKGVEPPPQFSAHFYCGQTAGCIKMPLSMAVGLSAGDIVLNGNPASSPTRGRSLLLNFPAHFYCGQTAGCIKMALGTEVSLGPVHIVLDGDTAPPAPLPKKGRGAGGAVTIRTIFIVAKRLHGSRCQLVRR